MHSINFVLGMLALLLAVLIVWAVRLRVRFDRRRELETRQYCRHCQQRIIPFGHELWIHAQDRNYMCGVGVSNAEPRTDWKLPRTLAAALLALGLFALPVQAQTTCSTSTPCVSLTWTATDMAATATTNASGVQTSGPGSSIVWKCVGSSGSCSAAALTAAIAAPASANVWQSATIPQTSAAGAYTDSAVYGQLVNYAVQSEWSGGAASSPSAIFQLSIGAAPVVGAPVPGNPSAVLVTSGTTSSPAIP
jgi:hypothetical protein